MNFKYTLFLLSFLVLFNETSFIKPAHAATCDANDRRCVSAHLAALATHIEKDSWRDQVYRELAKTMAADGDAINALPYIEKIINPDTQALCIRGIGMEAAMAGKVSPDLFTKLRIVADKISDPPSYAIALTYIAMGQAFAGMDKEAWKTASEMENQSLRNKAYGETGEIQAGQDKFKEALKSISFIDSIAYKNKAYKNVSAIFAENGKNQYAYDMALNIENPVIQAKSIQFILDKQRQLRERNNKAEE